ncbi:hypothetical protein [Labilibaculum sp.]|uniref:hypothetical protein n=1 Tax=Labilibaculum sp. TaxID=2060723 RepID=UPI002AA91432|nr:hypothetical protein [Labilibaculum sp.]
METLKKRIVWIVIIITFLSSALIKYFGGQELHSNEIIGYSLGMLIFPFLLSLAKGLYDLFRKKFSWSVMKNTFLILWLFFMVLSILFSPQYGLLTKKDDVGQLKELVKQYASEANSQRKEYHFKLSSIDGTDISKTEDIKNINILKKIKMNINNQEEVEKWNYKTCLSLSENWLDKFENYQKEHDNSETEKMIVELKENMNTALSIIYKTKQIQIDYYEKYNNNIDFLITENNNITFQNNTLIFKDQASLDKYNQLQGDFYKASKLYVDFVTKLKEEKTTSLDTLNEEYFNIQEIDTLIDMVRYNKYEN